MSEVRNITVTLKPKCGECLLDGRIIQAEVYPNPAEDILTIKAAEGTVFKLYDNLNREVLSGKDFNILGFTKNSIPLYSYFASVKGKFKVLELNLAIEVEIKHIYCNG